MAIAAIAAGADSSIVEVHPNPAKALSDNPQSLTPEQFDRLVAISVIDKAVERWQRPALIGIKLGQKLADKIIIIGT